MHVVNASVLKEASICTSKLGIVAGRSAVAQCMEHLSLNREKAGSNPVQPCRTVYRFVPSTLLQCILL